MASAKTVTGGRPATSGVIPGRWALSVGKPQKKPAPSFQWIRLSDIARLESGHTPSRRMQTYWDGDVPWIGIRDATTNHGRILYETSESVTDEGIAHSSARKLPEGTVCLSRTASVGYVVTMGKEMATSQDFVNWVCGPRLRSRYLHYILVAEQESVRRFAHGSVHPTVYYPEVKAFHVCIPEPSEQDAILAVLGTLDDKIYLNEQVGTTTYELAHSLWHQTTDGVANTATLSDLGRIEKGLSYKGKHLGTGLPMVNLANFRTNGTFNSNETKYYAGEYRERHLLQDGDLVIANTDLTQRREILGQAAMVSTDERSVLFSHHVFAVRPHHGHANDVLWLYGALRDQSFRDRAVTFASGTTVAALPMDAVLTYKLPWPPYERRQAWSQKAKALFDSAHAARTESAKLARLRNTLLPKLISGELRVKDAEKVVEEST